MTAPDGGFCEPGFAAGFLFFSADGRADRTFFLQTQTLIAGMAIPPTTCLEAVSLTGQPRQKKGRENSALLTRVKIGPGIPAT